MADKEKENAAPLSENELEGVSGGLWGITIWDTCEKGFNFNKCCYNLGKCPNLVVKKPGSHINSSTGTKMYDYTLSCAKEYFFNERFSTDWEIPNY